MNDLNWEKELDEQVALARKERQFFHNFKCNKGHKMVRFKSNTGNCTKCGEPCFASG